jgi:hypothetical protein
LITRKADIMDSSSHMLRVVLSSPGTAVLR